MTGALTAAYLGLLGVALLLVAVLVTVRAVRLRLERGREQRAAGPRRRLLAFVGEPEPPDADALVAMPEAEWAAVEPTATALLGKLRGEGYAALAEVFIRRGAAERARAGLRNRSAAVRAEAAQVLGDLGHVPAVPVLIRLLDDPSDEVAVVAVRALGRLGDARAAGPLLRALGDRELPAQLVARALGRLGEGALRPLVAALQPGHGDAVRVSALQALGTLVAPATLPPVAEVLAETGAAPAVRVAAARTLGRFGTRSTLAPLLAVVQAPGPAALRAAAAEALGVVGAAAAVPPLGALVHDGSYPAAHAAADALRHLGNAGSAELRRLADGPPGIPAAHAREAVARAALGGRG
ncbi:hypothetical protein GCM10010123_04890 [Pilimelia anulata]|uniref:Uncharacterized protein n=1 Tax=Pilimelia anulata TaxID=53371 RepID=A0A8J3AZS1_9ACTN|nr:HEAT repeat domain-containing protein [Pilimelia anulata]GGJ77863.1 hypothetical protein GCM10010123_04890 [Pilimelia anulata]